MGLLTVSNNMNVSGGVEQTVTDALKLQLT